MNRESSRLTRARHLKGTLSNASAIGWSQIERWAAGALPIIQLDWPENVDTFVTLTKEPQWKTLPLSLQAKQLGDKHAVAEREKRERKANEQLAWDKKAAILEFMRSLVQVAELDQPVNAVPTARSKKSAKVFVVHGHDNEMRESVARVLTSLGQIPVILHEKPNEGRTIIEKFEAHSDVGFAVVLLSADDIGASKLHPDASQPRARQNVILELGYFIGKLGRSRVCALKRGDDLEVPSDFIGVAYTEYDAKGSWRVELARELKSAGYPVDANALL